MASTCPTSRPDRGGDSARASVRPRLPKARPRARLDGRARVSRESRSSRGQSTAASNRWRGARLRDMTSRHWQVLPKIDMGQKLDEFSEPNMSGAIRRWRYRRTSATVLVQVSVLIHGLRVRARPPAGPVARLGATCPLQLTAGERISPARSTCSTRRHQGRDEQGGHEAVRGGHDVRLRGRRWSSPASAFAYRIAAHGRKPYWATNSRRRASHFSRVLVQRRRRGCRRHLVPQEAPERPHPASATTR